MQERKTAEGITIKDTFKANDHNINENSIAGKPPYLRGPYGSMYVSRPWTIRQYAGFSTAEESNAFYKRGES